MWKIIIISICIITINVIALIGYLIDEKFLMAWWGSTNISYPAIISNVLTNLNLLILIMLIGKLWKHSNYSN